MFLVEKIGQLILITLEGLVENNSIDIIKAQLKVLIEKEAEAVVSINHSSYKDKKINIDIETGVVEILKFCHDRGIRVYSYYSKE